MPDRGNHHSSMEIRHDIERTRSRMDETIRAIDSKMSLGQIVDQLFGIFRAPSETGMRTGSRRVIDAARANPLPLALIGAGVAWMLIEERRGSDVTVRTGKVIRSRRRGDGHPEAREEALEARRPEGQEGGGEFVEGYEGAEGIVATGPSEGEREQEKPGFRAKASEAKEKVSGAAAKLKDKAHEASSRMSETGGKVKGKLATTRDRMKEVGADTRDRMSHTRDRMKEARARGREKTKELGVRARDLSIRTRDNAVHQYDENPMAAGAVAFAIGMIGGLALPKTETEDRLMGRGADRVKGRLGDAGHAALEKGKRVASETYEAAKSSVEQQGLKPNSLIEEAGHAVAREAAEVGTRGAAPSQPGFSATPTSAPMPGEPGPEKMTEPSPEKKPPAAAFEKSESLRTMAAKTEVRTTTTVTEVDAESQRQLEEEAKRALDVDDEKKTP